VVSGQLHLYPDAPIGQAIRLRSEKGLTETMRVQAADTNRRVHMLAVNHRRTDLQNDKVRQGLAAAINRDGILTDVFSYGDAKAHIALTGPFPLRCWATPSTARNAPLYKAGAGGLINEGLNGRRIRLKLIFAKDAVNLSNLKVCQLIQKQIEQSSLDKDGKPSVEIDVQALTPEKFHEKLHLEFEYDLALTTFDYRDGTYSLDSILDPDASLRAGRNYLGYMAPGTNFGDDDRRMRKLIEGTGQDQDISKQVKDKTWEIHTLFNERVPFIPLWQLDRYMVVHRELEIYLDNPLAPVGPERLDPSVVFTGVEMWKWK
jgi:peptide/nickel transport system substrate-binding protein